MAALHILYDGPALDQHKMDVRDLAPALLAVGELLEAANEVLNGPKTRIHVQVSASFKAGSFGVAFEVGNLLQQALQTVGLDGASAKQILELLGLAGKAAGGLVGLVTFIRWLKKRKISKQLLLDNGRVRVYADDDSIEIEQKVLSLYRNYRVRKALEDAIKPLERDGIEHFAASAKPSESFETISKSELSLFDAVKNTDAQASDTSARVVLTIIAPVFQEGNKWRFDDGSGTFSAAIEDKEFLQRVERGERFGKGDLLVVQMQTVQTVQDLKISMKRTVTKVHEHITQQDQVPLL